MLSFEEKLRITNFTCRRPPTDIDNDILENFPCRWTPELSHGAVSGPRAAWLAGADTRAEIRAGRGGARHGLRLVITSDL